jgi:hypothetical protein
MSGRDAKPVVRARYEICKEKRERTKNLGIFDTVAYAYLIQWCGPRFCFLDVMV